MPTITTPAIPSKTFTTKQVIITAVIIFVIVAAIAIYFYRKGKKTTTIAKVPLDNANPGGNNSAGVSPAEITSIANDLHSDMDGFNIWGHDVEPFQRLNALSDTDFVLTYNTFNTLFQPSSSQTLKQWIDGETFAFDDVTDSILKRMGRLNLP